MHLLGAQPRSAQVPPHGRKAREPVALPTGIQTASTRITCLEHRQLLDMSS
jgi:hypothetical protein